jgi:hypothetical protein
MSKQFARKLTLALTLFALTAPGLHASTSPSTPLPSPPPAPQSVTGTDPVPTGSSVVVMILTFLSLA